MSNSNWHETETETDGLVGSVGTWQDGSNQPENCFDSLIGLVGLECCCLDC